MIEPPIIQHYSGHEVTREQINNGLPLAMWGMMQLFTPGKTKKAMNADPPTPAPSLALESILMDSPKRKGTMRPSVIQLTLFILKAKAGREHGERPRPLSYKDIGVERWCQ